MSNREASLDHIESLLSEAEDMFTTSGEWTGHWKEEMGPSEWAADPGTVLEQKEFWEILDRCLSALPVRLAQVFMLREMDGLSTDEICQAMNISASNLWVMLHRARMQLRRELEINYLSQLSQPRKTAFNPDSVRIESSPRPS